MSDRLREAMLRADGEDDPHSFLPREAAHEAVGRALQVANDDAAERERRERAEQAEQERRERDEDATADAMEIVTRARSRHGRTRWTRADGRAVRQIVDTLRGLMGDE